MTEERGKTFFLSFCFVLLVGGVTDDKINIESFFFLSNAGVCADLTKQSLRLGSALTSDVGTRDVITICALNQHYNERRKFSTFELDWVLY